MNITEIRRKLQEIERPGECMRCDKDTLQQFEMDVPEVVYRDCAGMCWCTEHRIRGDFLDILSSRGFPALTDITLDEVKYYSIEAGPWYAVQITLMGSDECITALAMAALEIQEVA